MPSKWGPAQPQAGLCIGEDGNQPRLGEDAHSFDAPEFDEPCPRWYFPEVGCQVADDDAAAAAREVVDDDRPAVGEMCERTSETRLNAHADRRARDGRPHIKGHDPTSISRPSPPRSSRKPTRLRLSPPRIDTLT